MKSLLRLFHPLFTFSYKHPKSLILVSTLLAVFCGYFALQLKIDTDLANLLPEDYPSVQALEKLKETVGGETFLEVAVYSPSFEANKAAAEALIPKSLSLYDEKRKTPFLTRAEFRKDISVLEDNALYFATDDELEELSEYLQDEIEDAKLEANPFYFDLDEDEETVEDDRAERFRESYESLVPKEYPVNGDSTVLVLKFVPSGSKSNLNYLRDLFRAYDSLIEEFDASEFHPEMQITYGGRLQKHLLDIDSILKDVQSSFGTGFGSVILLVALYFFVKKFNANRRKHGSHKTLRALFWRIPVPVMVIGLPLIFSLTYTFGLAYWHLGMLNTMTSVLFVILFGMGIDYGIHFYARYLEYRADAVPVVQSLEQTYTSTGESIFTSAVTTAIALYVLIIADFRGFSEFGLISGTGILLALVAMVFILPAFVTLFERWGWIEIVGHLDEEHEYKDTRFPYSRVILALGALVVVFVGYNYRQLEFEYDFGKLEQRHPEYDAFRELTSGSSSGGARRNPAYVILDDGEDPRSLLDALQEKMDEDTLSPSIKLVEALQDRFPASPESAKAKLGKIAEIRDLLDDEFIRSKENEDLDRLKKASQTREPLKLSEIPEYIRNMFVTKTGQIGRFVIIYPSLRLADGRNSIAFKDDVGTIKTKDGKTFHAGSTSIVAAEMLDLMRTESPYMVLGTLTLITIVMIFSFKSVRWALIGLLPLILGLIMTFAVLIIFDLRFNFYNLVVLPAILGIGEDNGVHLAHRYIKEGKGSMKKVLGSTGQHISIGSITTMLGFAGLLLTSHPGLYSIGLMATIGIGMTLLTALVFLPALVQFLEDRNWLNFD